MDKIRKWFPVAMLALLAVIVLLFILVQSPNHGDNNVNGDYASDGTPYYIFTDENGQIIYSPIKEFPTEEMVYYTESDINVIPDKYNTGADSAKVTKKVTKENYDSINKSVSFANDTDYLVLNFHNNKLLHGDYEISDWDFSDVPVRIYSEEVAPFEVCIIFENCVFSSFMTGESGNSKVNFIFRNCTFKTCAGCNMTFDSCYFGGSVSDGVNPYQNVYVNDCYFADRSIKYSDVNAGTHTDGVQIYGTKKYGTAKGVGGNIHFKNCRFELPQLKNTSSTINACIMLQLEFNDTANVSFENCKINGGGYSIYAYSKNDDFELTNALFKNISVGCARKFGMIYPTRGENVTFLNVADTDSLYVSSVRESSDGLHISVSNDTNKDRTLLIITNNGETSLFIPACPLYDEVTEDMDFEDFPFDIDICVGAAEWFVCYDITTGKKTQLRFYNTTENAIVLK